MLNIFNASVERMAQITVDFSFMNVPNSSKNVEKVFEINFDVGLRYLKILERNNMGPCDYGIARPPVADGGDGLQIWTVAAKEQNKQSGITDMWLSSSMGGWARD
jgi:hypothetical protein